MNACWCRIWIVGKNVIKYNVDWRKQSLLAKSGIDERILANVEATCRWMKRFVSKDNVNWWKYERNGTKEKAGSMNAVLLKWKRDWWKKLSVSVYSTLISSVKELVWSPCTNPASTSLKEKFIFRNTTNAYQYNSACIQHIHVLQFGNCLLINRARRRLIRSFWSFPLI